MNEQCLESAAINISFFVLIQDQFVKVLLWAVLSPKYVALFVLKGLSTIVLRNKYILPILSNYLKIYIIQK